jgi:hypothetical protein
MGRGRSVGITHTEINDVAPGSARLGFQRIDLAKDIGGKAFDAIEVFGHGISTAGERPFLSLRAAFGERYTIARRFAGSVLTLVRSKPKNRAGYSRTKAEVVSLVLVILHRLMEDVVGGQGAKGL